MVTTILHSTTGAVHLVAALAAMGLGTAVLLMPKATVAHKRVGYAYVAAMILVNVTAFNIYVLYHSFGPFHFAALWSSGSIAAGMVPVLLKRPGRGKWLGLHYYFMNWSVVGLYAAFWAETLVRLFPMQQFWPVVIVATLGTTAVGGWLIRKHQARLTNQVAAPADSVSENVTTA